MRNPKGMASGFTLLFATLAEFVLVLRAVLLLLDADTTNSFVVWVYAMSAPLLGPLDGLVDAAPYSQRFVLDFRTLGALAFWAVLSYIVLALLEWVRKPRLAEGGWRAAFRSKT